MRGALSGDNIQCWTGDTTSGGSVFGGGVEQVAETSDNAGIVFWGGVRLLSEFAGGKTLVQVHRGRGVEDQSGLPGNREQL